MVGGFRETWVFVNKIRNVICMRKMCSVIWHLDGHSIFLFSPPRKSVSNVSATENMEQQEQKLMQEGHCRIVIQLTSLAGTFPLPRFLPRNRLNKELLRHEGWERGRIFLWSACDRQRIVQQTLINSPYISPAVNLCKREKGSQYFCRLEKGAGCWGSQCSQSRVLVPFVPDPLTSPHCWGLAFLAHFSLGHIMPHPKDMSPDTCCKRQTALSQEDQCFPGLGIQQSTEKPVGKQQQIIQSLVTEHLWKAVSMEVFRRRTPLLTLAPATTTQRQKSVWDSSVVSGILLQASTHLKCCFETFTVCWEAPVVTSERGKSGGFSGYFSLPTSAGQERASFHLQPKTFWSQMDLGFSHSAIPLREGEPEPN